MVFLSISHKITKFLLNSNTITVLFFVVLLLTKLIYLDSDTVAITNLHNEDEGNYVYNVRNFIVEGKLFKDDANFILLSPLYSFLLFIPAKILGISIFSFRLVSAVSGIILVVLFYKIFAKTDKVLGFTAALILGTDFLFNIHSRIAMPEITVSLFYLLVYITFIKAMSLNSNRLFLLTGLVAGTGFLIKSSAILMIAVTCGYLIFKELIKIYKTKNINLNRMKQLLIRISLIGITALIPILIWQYLIIKPNTKHFELVSITINSLHKPQIREQLLNATFLSNEANEFIKGGEGDIWIYLLVYIVTIFTGTAVLLQNKTKIHHDSFWLAVLWLFVGNMYFFILWYKPARWYIPNIIPLIIITVYILKELPREIRSILLTSILLVNIALNYYYLYRSPTYYLKDGAKEIEKIVGTNTYAGDSLVLMENSKSKAINPYFIQPDYTLKTFDLLLKENNFPAFLVLGENKFNGEIDKTKKYELIQIIQRSTNLIEPRKVYIYKTK